MTRAEQQQQTREAVIAAADALFVERGFHASSVGHIAAAAGYTKGAVYSNFASKEDVFFAVYERRSSAAGRRDGARAGRAIRRPGIDAITLARRAAARHRRGRLAGGVLRVLGARRPPPGAARALRGDPHARARAVRRRARAPRARARGGRCARRVVAVYAMQLGLSLERLTQPDLVDERARRADGEVVPRCVTHAGAR